jgi:hypothetical protein
MKLGTYRHYKGKYYQVIGVAKHSETLEELVVYYCLYPNKTSQLWVRPDTMFSETVLVDGEKMPRFTFIKDRKELP